MDERDTDFSLVCRVGATRLCALPLAHVLETLRPQRLEPLNGAPPHVLGIALIRGVAQPVVDVARLLGERPGASHEVSRYVTLRVDERRVALAVGEVLGIRAIAQKDLQPLPPLLRHAAQGTVAALAAFDAELLLVLDSARLLPDEEPPPPEPPPDEPVEAETAAT